jgi:hypothetical protein
LQLNNMAAGNYALRMFNTLGQLIMGSSIKHQGGSSIHPIAVDKSLAKGIYRLEVIDEKENVSTINLRIQ